MLQWTIDRRSEHGQVGRQGLRGTCLAWAITAAHQHAWSAGDLSVEYLHWATGNYPLGRGRVASAAVAVEADGQPPESQWPYSVTTDDNLPSYQPPATVNGPYARARIRRCESTVTTLTDELNAGNCPVVALRVTDSFLGASGGVVTIDGPGLDGHAVVAVGIAEYQGTVAIDGIEPGASLVCVRNSWGTTWGSMATRW